MTTKTNITLPQLPRRPYGTATMSEYGIIPECDAVSAQPAVDPDFVADLARSQAKYLGNARMFDGLMGEVDELRRAYAGDGDIRAEAFDVAVCAYRIATEGDTGGNTKLVDPQPSVPDEWKLVPVEPTEAMIDAFYKGPLGFGPTAVYAAMLAASPTPPADGQPEKKLPDLIVTKNGVPFEDQAEGVRQFKAACFGPADRQIVEDALAYGIGALVGDKRIAPQDLYLPAQQDADRVDDLSQAARDVLAERQRQISAEGWTPEHDDEHSNGEMAEAAACYASPSIFTLIGLRLWPWDRQWWKPSDPRRNLVKSGALVIAEIERLDRAAARAQQGGQS